MQAPQNDTIARRGLSGQDPAPRNSQPTYQARCQGNIRLFRPPWLNRSGLPDSSHIRPYRPRHRQCRAD